MNKTAYQYKDDCPATTLTSFMKRNVVTAAGAVVSKDIQQIQLWRDSRFIK